MRSLVYVLFLLLLIAIGFLVRRERAGGTEWEHLPLAQSSGTSLNQIASQTEAMRDESGVLILSNPADDLGGFEAPEGQNALLDTPVGERALYLLELYGGLTGEQLALERRVLQERYDADRALGIDVKDDAEMRELRDTLEWLGERLGDT